jgi:hypothetical protein
MPKVHPLRERGSWGNLARKNPPVEAESPPRVELTLGDCIAIVTARREDFLAEQHDEVIRMLRAVFKPGDVFSALQLWLESAFRSACIDAGIYSPRSLGKRFQHWPELTRIGSTEHGAALWTLTRE